MPRVGRLPAAAAALLLAAPSVAMDIPEGTIRLVSRRLGRYDSDGYLSKQAGLLQIHHNGQWGTICEEEFYSYDANVACVQLGLGYYYWYEDAEYFYDDDDHHIPGHFERTPEEDTDIIWSNGDFECDYEAEGTLLDCGMYYSWGDTNCDHTQDVALFCHFPSVPKLEYPNVIVDVGFSDTGTECVSIRQQLNDSWVDWSHSEVRRRRRRTTTTITTTRWTDTTTIFCSSVYSGGAQMYNSEEPHRFEITHRSHDEVCVTRTDGLQAWYGYLRLHCRYVDLASPLVSYRDKGGCGPRGTNASADASLCPHGLRVVAAVGADAELAPVAVLNGGSCPVFEYTVHECVDEVAPEPACEDLSPPGGGPWHDADGESFGCGWYSANSVCSVANRGFGRTAAEACCSCGGGAAEVVGSLTFRSTGAQAEVKAAALSALGELLGVDEAVLAPALRVAETDSRTTTTATSTMSRTFTETTTTSSSTETRDTVTETSTTFATSTTTTVTATITTGTSATTTVTAEDPLIGATWWQADYSLSLGLSACQQVAERSDNVTGTAQLLALRLAAANLTLDEGALYFPAAKLTPKQPTTTLTTSTGTTTRTSTATTSTNAAATGEPSQGVPTGMAVGLGTGALAVGLAAGAAAMRFGPGRGAPTNKQEGLNEVTRTDTHGSDILGV